jgi:integrase
MSAPRETTNCPGIYKRGGRYSYLYRDEKGRRRWGSAATLAEARTAKAATVADVARGEFRSRSRITFAEYAAKWIASYGGRTRKGIGPETLADYRKALGLDEGGEPTGTGAVAYFGRCRLVDIDPSDVKAYAAHVAAQPRKRGKGKLSAGTVRLQLAPVKALFATAFEEDGLLRSNPAAIRLQVGAAADALVEDEEHVKALTGGELVALLGKLPERWRVFFALLAEMGLRIGEAVELRWSDINLGDRTLHVRRRFYRGRVARPKGRKTRRLRLTPEMSQALWALRKDTRAADDDLVFVSDKGRRIDESNLMSRVLKPAAVEVGLGSWVKGKRGRRAETWVGFHSFRHTCATMLIVEEGWSLEQVQVFLGHSDYATTRKYYVHLIPEELPQRRTVLGGNRVVTRAAETGRDELGAAAADSAG